MIDAIARAFSSNVALPPVGYRYAYSDAASSGGGDEGEQVQSSFGPLFDQAAAKLELSREAVEKATTVLTAGEVEGRLNEEQRRQIEELAKRDREVKAHEQAHKAAAGAYAQGGPNYEYQAGPDGRRYAVGGSVDIDTSPVRGNPEATLEKAQVIRGAAMAPADPSGADRSVAAAAAQLAAQARKELAAENGAKAGASASDRGDSRIRGYGKPEPRPGGNFDARG